MYYSPILFSRIADLNLTQYHDCTINMKVINNKENVIVYCLNSMSHLSKLDIFLKNIEKPFVLITAMEDTQVPLEIDNKLLNSITTNLHFKHWFAINKTFPNNDKFTSIPYGLNYWTLTTMSYFGEPIQSFEQQNNILQSVISKSSHFTNRIPKIYANFHLNKTDERHGGWRTKLPNIIPNNIIYYENSVLPRRESYERTINYAFVISPFGHGFDCIRTFEALCLGCIVIMKKSFLDIIYEDLPILLVDEWSDINEDLLNKTLVEYSKKTFNYNKLTFNYWENLVKSKF